MMSLPMSLIGVFLGLLIAGTTLNIFSAIGFIMLMGLVTKNAILLVDFFNQARARGTPVNEALLEAGSIRLRPILMTTLAMVFGMMPLALGLGEGASQRAPMAHAVIGGLISSTLLTLVVVPVVLVYIDRVGPGRASASAARPTSSRHATNLPSRIRRPIPRNSWHDSSYARPCRMTPRPSACGSSNRFPRSTPQQWDACALAPGSAGNPFLSYRFLKALEDSKSVGRRTGWQPQYLLAEIRRRHPAGRRPALRERPQPGRIRLRPWLGAGLRARRRPLLSQAPGRGALHAGAGPAPVRAPRPARRRRARRHDRHAGQDRRRQPHQLGPCHLLHRGRLEALRRARLAAAAGPAVSLAQ